MADPVGPQMKAVLTKYGLSSLATWVSYKITSGIGFEQIMLELYDTPEFKAAYPEIEARRLAAQQRGQTLQPISVDDVLAYRTQARAIMKSYGLPPSFYQSNQATAAACQSMSALPVMSNVGDVRVLGVHMWGRSPRRRNSDPMPRCGR